MLSNILKTILGILLAMAILVGSSAALAIYFMNRTSMTPPKPVFSNDKAAVKAQARKTPTPEGATIAAKPKPTPTKSASEEQVSKRWARGSCGGEDDGEEEKATEVLFQDIAEHCTRRTAASVFFETLQLKTWDFIEVDQDEEYGPITITPGARFQEAPPNN